MPDDLDFLGRERVVTRVLDRPRRRLPCGASVRHLPEAFVANQFTFNKSRFMNTLNTHSLLMKFTTHAGMSIRQNTEPDARSPTPAAPLEIDGQFPEKVNMPGSRERNAVCQRSFGCLPVSDRCPDPGKSVVPEDCATLGCLPDRVICPELGARKCPSRTDDTRRIPCR